MTPITVYKRDHRGRPVWHYTGTVAERGPDWVRLHAYFGRELVDIGLVTFRRGDLMVEWFYADRYYNVFQLHDGDGGPIKGWYCNITRPADITADTVAADDLALDVFVSPRGEITVLDEDEFAALELDPAEQAAALAAVDEIRGHVRQRQGPFVAITD
jgi:uncharacterized protein